MLRITTPEEEFFDEVKDEFVSHPGVEFDLEHSLVSLSKWESKYHRAFLSKSEKSEEEVLDYISMMIVTPGIPPEVVRNLGSSNLDTIRDYIVGDHTATTFPQERDKPGSPNRETITSELIYFWMINHNIPFTCETWNINRLLTLIKVCVVKTQKPKKRSPAELAAYNRELNAKRRAEFGTSG